MRLVAFDLAVNGAMLALDVVVLIVLWKKRNARLFALMLGVQVAAVGVGVMASTAVFGIFGAMRALAWSVVLAGGACLLWKPCRKPAIASGVASLLIALVGLDAFFIEPSALGVTRVRMLSRKLTRPIKIAILADIQTDVIGAHERRALQRAAAEKAD